MTLLNGVQRDCTGYELALGSISGYRKFAVDPLGRLRGIHHAQVWTPGENAARCRVRYTDDALHSDSCPCGFYAFLDCTERRYGNPNGFIVGGIIEGYGKTLIGRKGFRCEKARVLVIVMPWRKRLLHPSVSRLLRRNYPDLSVVASKRIASRRHGVTLRTAQTPESDPDFWTRP